jgi:hypothetical protein
MQALRAVPEHTLQAIMQKQAHLWKGRQAHETANEVLSLPREYITQWVCSHQTRLDLRGSQVPLSKLLRLVSILPEHRTLRVLHLPCSAAAMNNAEESLCVLHALKEAVSSWRPLSVLGLHSLQLRKQHLVALSAIFYYLKDCLTGLALSLRDWQCQAVYFNFSTQCKLQFFEDVTKLQNLRFLALPQWEQFVSSEHAVLTPLRKFQELTILVDSCPKVASEACAIVPGLRFSQVMTGMFR